MFACLCTSGVPIACKHYLFSGTVHSQCLSDREVLMHYDIPNVLLIICV